MGGSGGGGRGLSEDELKALEQIAKDTLKGSISPEKRNVFISFASEDLTEVYLLRGQAQNENSELGFIDRSLQRPFDSKDAEYIKRGIRERIKQASVTICYLSEHTAQSKWVDWEIRESIKLNKGVIAMYKGDNPPRKLPPAVKEFGIKLVPWNHKQIMAAINRAAEDRS